MSNCDQHDCFDEAKASRDALEESSDRVGFYLFVRDDATGVGDYHWLGNSAFAGQAFEKLVELTAEGHVYGKCDHCDRVVRALTKSLLIYREMTRGGNC